ncbi:hypothetical protein A2U01_0090481, partial [Trifolium medium]|nr:hypothetical protein [Trifolium medium]
PLRSSFLNFSTVRRAKPACAKRNFQKNIAVQDFDGAPRQYPLRNAQITEDLC